MTIIPLPKDGFRAVPIPHLARGGRWRVEEMRSYGRARLLWFTRGQGRITVAGVTRGYGAHNAVFLPAGTMHGFEVKGTTFGTALDFPRSYKGLLPDAPMHLRVRDVATQAEMHALLDRFQSEISSDAPGRERALSAYGDLIALWLDRQNAAEARTAARQPAARNLAQAYSDLIERDFKQGRTVADFAADLGVTPTHLTRVCNATAGKSAHALLSARIIAEAHEMLADTDRPIRSIAASLGFSSAAYFTRAFQSRTGLTPSEFRRTASL